MQRKSYNEEINDLKRRVGNLETKHTFSWDYYDSFANIKYVGTPPALFGGTTVYPKSLAFSVEGNVPCTAEIEVTFEKLSSYFEKISKENIKTSDKEEQRWFSSHNFQDLLSSYYHQGKAEAYKRAAEKVREILAK